MRNLRQLHDRSNLPAFIKIALALLCAAPAAMLAQDGPLSSIQRLGLTAQQQTAPTTQGVIRPGAQPAASANPLLAPLQWTAATACPAPVFRYAFAQNGEDFYVISGISTGPNTTNVWRYNATTNVWTKRANIPTASNGPAGAFLNGKIYVVTGDGTANAFYIYDVATDVWSSGPARPGFADSFGAAAGAYNGKVYFVGGGGAGPTTTVSVYTVATNSWSVGPAALSPVQLAGYTQVGQFLYVIGGFTATTTNSTACMRLDMANNTWSNGPTFTLQRADFGLAAAGTKLIAIGGDATGADFFDPTPFVDELDTSTWPSGTWVQSPDDLPAARQGNSAGFVGNGRVGGEIWSTGGATVSFINDNLFRAAPICAAYTYTVGSGSIVPGTVDTTNHGDDDSTVIMLPFSYHLYDQNFSNVAVGSNGHLTFGTVNNQFDPTCIPIVTATYAIGPYWTDQCTGACFNVSGAGLGIFTSTSGVVPNRIFNIEWRTAYYNSGGSGVLLNYEVRLYEGQASFDVIYGTVNTFNPPAARKLSTGVQKNNSPNQFTLEGCDSTGGTAPPVSSGQLYHYTLTNVACPPAPTPTGFLYVLNAQSPNQLYGFSVNETTGALSLLSGFPFSTGGNTTNVGAIKELALDSVNQRLYATNTGTVSAYAIDPTTGALTSMPFSPIVLTNDFNVASVHPSGSPLVLGFANGAAVASYNITPTTAIQAAGSPYSTGSAAAFSATFSRNGAFYYTGGNTGTTFAGFGVNAGTGVLTALAGSPFSAGNFGPTAYVTDSQGRFLTALFDGLRAFTTAAGVPSPVTGNPFASGITQEYDGVLHPNEQFYFVTDPGSARFGSYRMNGSGSGTTLTPVLGSPFASGGAFTVEVVMNRNGAFLFGANADSRNLTTYAVNSASGVLSSQVVQPANTLGTTGNITGLVYTNASIVRTAVSRKTHGAAGVFDVNLPLTGIPGVECRTSPVAGDQQIVVTFAAPVTVGAITVPSGIFSGGGYSTAANVVSINLNGVTNAQTLVLEFQNATDGVNTSTFRVPVSFLIGDTNGSGAVSAADISQTKAQSGQSATGANFRTDVNLSGSISAADISLVKSRSGTSLPP